MSPRAILFIAAAVLLTGGTVYVAQSWIANQQAQMEAMASKPEKPEQRTYVLVAGQDLATGSFVQENNFRWQAWPDDNLTSSYLLKDAFDPKELQGRVVRRSVAAGQPVSQKQFVAPGERGFLAAVLRPGFRAVTIPMDTAAGVAGLVFPGDRVDIILTRTVEIQNQGGRLIRSASETVLENVRVLAIDQRLNGNQPDSDEAPLVGDTATLEVVPKHAEMLMVSRKLGSLSLSLRSLARDEKELASLTEAGESVLEDPETVIGESMTEDFEASQFLTGGGSGGSGGGHGGPTVRVVRGGEVSDKSF